MKLICVLLVMSFLYQVLQAWGKSQKKEGCPIEGVTTLPLVVMYPPLWRTRSWAVHWRGRTWFRSTSRGSASKSTSKKSFVHGASSLKCRASTINIIGLLFNHKSLTYIYWTLTNDFPFRCAGIGLLFDKVCTNARWCSPEQALPCLDRSAWQCVARIHVCVENVQWVL